MANRLRYGYMKMHKVNLEPNRAVFLLTRKHDGVRYWFNVYGDLCAVWTSKTGRQRAIGRMANGGTYIY